MLSVEMVPPPETNGSPLKLDENHQFSGAIR